MAQLQHKRLPIFDNVKFILIVLVIYCHLINVGFAVPWKVYQIIYSFHMPLFVLISGFFTDKDKPALKYWDVTLNFAFLFVVFNLVTIYIYIYLCDQPPVKYPYIPSFALWYLLCMIYWRTLVWCIPNRILKSKLFFILVLAISILPSVYYLNYFALSRCLSFAPYFLVGWYLRNFDVITWLQKLNTWLKIGIVISAVIGCLFATKIPISIFWGHEPTDIDFIRLIIFKGFAWIIAILNSIALFLIIPRSLNFSEGQHTLSYYLIHTLILFPILDYISKLLPSNYLLTLLVLLVTLTIIAAIRRIKIIDRLLRIRPMDLLGKHNNKK